MKKLTILLVLTAFFSVTPCFATEYVLLNLKNNTYHKPNCKYGQMARESKLIRKPLLRKYHPANCCYPELVNQKSLKNPGLIKRKKEQILLNKLGKQEISLFFVDPIGAKKPKNKCINDVGRSLVTLIDNSKNTLDMAVYGFDGQDEIIDALRRAKARGVIIRGVVDDYGSKIYHDTPKIVNEFGLKTDVYVPIAQKQFDEAFTRSQSALMHNKFFVIDKKFVWTGSTNITNTCMTYNSNNSVVIYSPEIANIYTQEFSQMFEEDKFHTLKTIIENKKNIKLNGNTDISIYFSPQDKAISCGILPLLKEAQKSINISMFYLTNYWITDELIEAKNRGVKIRIILDATLTKEPKSQIEPLRKANIPVKTENWRGKMHQKTVIVDDIYSVIASTNWTGASEYANDENMLVIKNEELANQTTKEFNRLWKSIPNKYLKENPPLPVYTKLE